MGWGGGRRSHQTTRWGTPALPPSPPNSGGLRSCLLITTTKNHTRVPPLQLLGCSSLLWGSQRESAGEGGWRETVGGEAEGRGERRLRDKKGGGKGAERVERESWTETKAQRERSGEGREKCSRRRSGARGAPGMGRWPPTRRPPAPARPGHLAVAVVPQALREVQAGGVPGRRGVESHIHAGAGPGAGGRDWGSPGPVPASSKPLDPPSGAPGRGCPGGGARDLGRRGAATGSQRSPGAAAAAHKGAATRAAGEREAARGTRPAGAPRQRCAPAGRPGRGARRGGPGRRGEFRCAGRGWDDDGGGGGGWPRSSSSSPGGLRRGAAETRGPAPPLLLPLLPPSAAGPLPAPPPLRPSHRGQLARRPPRRCALGPDRLRARGPRPAGPCPARPLAAHPAPRAALDRPVARAAASPSPGPLFFPPRPPSLSGPLCPRCLGALLAPLLPSAASASPVPGVDPRPLSDPRCPGPPAPASSIHAPSAPFPPPLFPSGSTPCPHSFLVGPPIPLPHSAFPHECPLLGGT